MTSPNNTETNLVIVRMAEDRSALTRLTSTVLRRGYFIESLSAGRELGSNLLRITMKIMGDRARPVRLMAQQLLKVVDTVEVCIQEEQPGMQREMALLRLAWNGTSRESLLALTERNGGRIVAMGEADMVVEISGSTTRLDEFLAAIPASSLLETARTGAVSMFRDTPGSEVWIKN